MDRYKAVTTLLLSNVKESVIELIIDDTFLDGGNSAVDFSNLLCNLLALFIYFLCWLINHSPLIFKFSSLDFNKLLQLIKLCLLSLLGNKCSAFAGLCISIKLCQGIIVSLSTDDFESLLDLNYFDLDLLIFSRLYLKFLFSSVSCSNNVIKLFLCKAQFLDMSVLLIFICLFGGKKV